MLSSKLKIHSLLLLVVISQVVGFAHVGVTSKLSTATELLATRRKLLETTILTAAGAVAISTPAAFADVSDGNELPNGIAQFARLVKTKSNIAVSLGCLRRYSPR